ncbi:sugar ABC transporter substrate-binding protein [Brachybacterium sp. P6-10-X1]|uniref:ABC transporter substrate-binding protein n=1 Tax=Brachybacterium sp. P6-10-X1 TaxID=1903186 RepID=UPI00097193FE|nr:extracellular solute-binding protein [Brachybacterium sp. P6-10-X1]APX32294.1 sugar ABC transporter substrate-binding protein [Brachybacterium sp. P6-10-X1]
MAIAGALPLALAGCGADPTISEDPEELVMWYWNRSAAPQLLERANQQIPGTDKHLRADVIGTSFDTKLRTSLAGNAYIPDITYINSNNALYFTNEDLFLDLSELGADSVRSDYYPWKWDLGMTPKGRFCFFPVDIGPTGFFYRHDIFEQAGLPSSPEDVATATSTWEDWIALGAELKSSAESFLVNDADNIYTAVLDSSPERYFDENDVPLYLRPDSTVRHAWNLAVAAIEQGITARIPADRETDRNAAWSSGLTAGNIGAAWWTQILEESAPETAGSWRIAAQPVRAGNNGGSFIALPHTCKDPEAAMRFTTWISSAKNQAVAYEDVQLFPSTPGSFELLTYEGDFYGGQDPLEFFSTAAETVPTSFISTLETYISGAFSRELTNVETGGKDPELAWRDALTQAEKVLAKRGADQ